MSNSQAAEAQFVPAKSFVGMAKTEAAQNLWQFLNEKETVLRMKVGSYLGHPAIEAIQPELAQRFGSDFEDDRFKQLCGQMARQVMEANGYQLDRNGVRLRKRELFTSGSRYVPK